jgi:hypothetical protein
MHSDLFISDPWIVHCTSKNGIDSSLPCRQGKPWTEGMRCRQSWAVQDASCRILRRYADIRLKDQLDLIVHAGICRLAKEELPEAVWKMLAGSLV